MPCWYYDKKDLQNTPSIKDGISPETETRYRKEGARFIIDAGNAMGLKYNTCATGVVYFHRFYMFHSFSKFPRWVTAACCLFLAGKVEETPKKCRDLIKTVKDMLSEAQITAFKDDAKEEIMTMERILLQTIKFDLMVEHPYDFLIPFWKLIKADTEKDKKKVQNLVQMSWTFVNDSLCTTLCIQWEPDVIAVAIMYLVSRLNKFEITNWTGKPVGFRGKWYEFFVDDISLDLLEDICHQVLDLYSQKQTTSPVSNTAKKSLPNAAGDFKGVADSDTKNVTPTTPQPSTSKQPNQSIAPNSQAAILPSVNPQQFSHANPYVSTGMYSSSFLNREGSQNIRSLINNDDGAKIAGLPFQQVPMQFAYQQSTSSCGTPTLAQLPQTHALQGFPPNPVNDGGFVFQNVAIQGKGVYQDTSASLQSNHHWR